MAARKTRKRFGRGDWLDLAAMALAKDGPEAVKLERICARAKLTRGSFYHHFKDHAAFLTALAEHWAALTRKAMVADRLHLTPEDEAASLRAALKGLDQGLELGMRMLAARNSAIATVVACHDAERIAQLADIQGRRFGLGPDEATRLAQLDYAAFVGTGFVARDPVPVGDLLETLIAARFG